MIGERNEQLLIEDLIIESIRIYGVDLIYLPRTLVSVDELFLEDTLSRFRQAFPLEAYIENVDGFGNNDVLSKFGIQINDSGTFVVSRRRWEQLVGRANGLQLPNRPAEGDIVYFPKTNSFFEIKKVDAFNPFFQLGKLYVYKLQVELYQYSSERFDTGIELIDETATNKSLDILVNKFVDENGDNILLEDDLFGNTSYFVVDDTLIEDAMPTANNEYFRDKSDSIIDWSGTNPFGENS